MLTMNENKTSRFASVKEAASFSMLCNDLTTVGKYALKGASYAGGAIVKASKSAAFLFLMAFTLLIGLTATAAHAAPVTIPLTNIDLDWTSFATQLGTSLASVIAVAIGVGIGVWMVRLVYRIFKSFARG